MLDSKEVPKKVDQSVQVETVPKKPGGLLQELCFCCRSSEKKQDSDSDQPSNSSKETVKPRKNKILDSFKGIRPSSSTLHSEETKKSKRRRKSKSKPKENSTEQGKENIEHKENKENKESKDQEKKDRDKENIESKEKENIKDQEKEKEKEKKKYRRDRKERKERDRAEKKEKEKREKEKEVDEQKQTIEMEKKTIEKEETIPEVKEEKMKRKMLDLIDNKPKVETKENTETEIFSKSHKIEKKLASFSSSSSVVEVLCPDQQKLTGLRKCPGFKKKTTSSPFEPPPTISVQKYEQLPSTSYKYCAPVDSHKQIQVDVDGPCSGYCARYLETDNTNKQWNNFAKKNCKAKIEDEVCKPQKRSKSPKPKKESHPPSKNTFWKKLKTRLPFLHKKSKKSSKKYCRSHSGSAKKRSKCKVKYCSSEECIQQQSSQKKHKKSKDKSKVEKVQDVKRSSKKDKACSAKSELQSISITVCTTRRVGIQKSAENYSSDESSDEDET